MLFRSKSFLYYKLNDSYSIDNGINYIIRVLRRMELKLSEEFNDSRLRTLKKTLEEFYMIWYSTTSSEDELFNILINLKSNGSVLYLNYLKDKERYIDQVIYFYKILINENKSEDDIEEAFKVLFDVINRILVNDFEQRYVINGSKVIDSDKISSMLENSRIQLAEELNVFKSTKDTIDTHKLIISSYIGTIDDLYVYLDMFFSKNLRNRFLAFLANNLISPKLTNKVLVDSKESVIKDLLDLIQEFEKKPMLLMGYRRSFYGYRFYNEYIEFLESVKDKLQYSSGHKDFIIFNKNRVQLSISSIEFEVTPVTMNNMIEEKLVQVVDENIVKFEKLKDIPMVIDRTRFINIINSVYVKSSIIVKYKIEISDEIEGYKICFEKNI